MMVIWQKESSSILEIKNALRLKLAQITLNTIAVVRSEIHSLLQPIMMVIQESTFVDLRPTALKSETVDI